MKLEMGYAAGKDLERFDIDRDLEISHVSGT
jgi:hypothetical protein